MHLNRYFRVSCLLAVLSGWLLCPVAVAAKSGFAESTPDFSSFSAVHSETLYIAQAKEKSKQESKPRSGELVMPSNYDENGNQGKKEKTCIRVCSSWGETCVYDINKGRKCRRTCKETSMECFDK